VPIGHGGVGRISIVRSAAGKAKSVADWKADGRRRAAACSESRDWTTTEMMRATAGWGDRRDHGRSAAAVIVALLAGLLLAGCNALMGVGTLPTTAVGPDRVKITDAASAENARIVAAYGGIYHDPKLEQMLARVVGRVVTSSDRPDQPYSVTILNAPAVNAFAIPGGSVFVTRGLLALANDSSEVAAVIAHELGHITANHAVARQNKARDAMIVSRVVTDVLDDSAGKLALASSQRSLAAFSRQQELEADAIGVRTVGHAGYDAFAAARFLEAMGRFSRYRSGTGKGGDGRPDFLASHPSTPERVGFAERAAREFGAPGTGETDRDRYLSGIDGVIYGDDPGQGYVRDRTFVHPTLGVSFTVPPGFVIDNTADAVLATGTDGTALRFDAVALARESDLAAYLASGWVNGLVAGSVRTFSVRGLPGAIASANAQGWTFQIAVVQTPTGATYRFIFANEVRTADFDAAAMATVSTFQQLDATALTSLRPLRVHVVVVAAGDSEDSLVSRMRGVDRPRELFRILNELAPSAQLAPGSKVKIVSD
jgi:predicted Zn-dependent protease